MCIRDRLRHSGIVEDRGSAPGDGAVRTGAEYGSRCLGHLTDAPGGVLPQTVLQSADGPLQHYLVRDDVIPVSYTHLRIVLISSIGGRTGRPGVGVNYAAAKGGIVGMTQLLGFELGPWNITVNCVAPGPIGGGMFASLPAENREKLLQGIRLGRIGTFEDVASAIAYLGRDVYKRQGQFSGEGAQQRDLEAAPTGL